MRVASECVDADAETLAPIGPMRFEAPATTRRPMCSPSIRHARGRMASEPSISKQAALALLTVAVLRRQRRTLRGTAWTDLRHDPV